MKSQNSVLYRRTVSEAALWTWSCAINPTYTFLREPSCSYAQLEKLILQTARGAKIGRKKMFQIEDIDHVALIVQDRVRAVKWYQEVLGMERRYQEVWTGKRDPVVMATGNVQIALFLPGSSENIRPYDLNEHFAVRVDRANFEQACRELEGRGIPFKVWDHKICLSLYLFDPDGNQM